MRKRFLQVFLLLIGSLFIAGLLGEALLRLTIKDQIVLYPRYHTDATYGKFRIRRYRPNSVFWHTSVDGKWRFDTNDKGFRNSTNFPYVPDLAKLRIISLGDSHTAGYEVSQNETYSAVLDEILFARGIDAEVINTGISGFGTAEQLVFFENEGIRYQPDIVILGFYANDFQDNVKAGIYSLQNGVLTLEKTEHLPGIRIQNTFNRFFLIRWLSENSYFFSFSFNAVYEIAKSALNATAKKKVQTEYAIPVGNFSEYQYSLATALIHRLFEICQENAIKLIILDIPTPTKTNQIYSSIPLSLRRTFQSNSDIFIDSQSALAPMVEKNILIHVPHGHHHISAESHGVFAGQLASEILQLLPSQSDPLDP